MTNEDKFTNKLLCMKSEENKKKIYAIIDFLLKSETAPHS